jgi:FAD/FMN-containing dehydrogenase
MAAVAWAGRRDVSVVPRSGGHSYAGYSTGDGVLVLDVRRLNTIQLHRRSRKATVGPGAQLIDVYMRLAQGEVTVPAGSCPSVGFGGMATGGGMGLAGRRFGLTCDSIDSMDVVTADGALRHVSSRSEPDLFWALRGGGGGNFGVVTRFVMRTHAVSHGSWFSISWPWAQAGAALDAWQQLMSGAASGLTSVFHLSTGTSTPQVGLAGQYLGSPAHLERLLAPLAGTSRSVGTSTYRDLMLRWAGCLGREPAVCHTVGTAARGGLDRARFGAKSDYVQRPLSSGARAALVNAIADAQRHTSEHSAAILLDSYGGAINDLAADATAFAHRDALCSIQYLTYFGSEAAAGAARAWRQRAWHAMRPYVSGGAYLNYIDPDLPGWRTAYYGSNAARLREVKRQVDPDFRFRFAQAIAPAGRD